MRQSNSKLGPVVLLSICVLLLISSHGVMADTRVATADIQIAHAAALWRGLTLAETVFIEEAPVPKEPHGTGSLAGYTLESMQAWMPPPNKMAGKATHLAEIARDIAWVALEDERIWKNSDASCEAILLARIGWFETLFRDYVDEGSCNVWSSKAYAKTGMLNTRVLSEEAQKLMQLGTCDGGQAVGIHQVHYPYTGIMIMLDGSWHNGDFYTIEPRWTIKRSDALVTPDMDAFQRSLHRRANIRVALAMARQSVKQTGGLRNYVGGEGPERNEMAAMRFDSAMAWCRKHPYKPE